MKNANMFVQQIFKIHPLKPDQSLFLASWYTGKMAHTPNTRSVALPNLSYPVSIITNLAWSCAEVFNNVYLNVHSKVILGQHVKLGKEVDSDNAHLLHSKV